MVLAVRLRKGRAADVRGAARFLAEALSTVRAIAPSAQIVVRADAKFSTADVVATAARYDAHVSVTTGSNPSVNTAIAQIPDTESWNGLAPFDRSAEPIVPHLLAEGFLEQDGELLFIGPQAEAKFGRRHFMGMTAVFTAPPQFTVLSGRQEIGRTDPALLTEKVDGRLLLLAGRTWRVTWTDWKRRRCFVEPAEGTVGKARWLTGVGTGASFALTRAVRDVLLGSDPPVALTQRAGQSLAETREDAYASVHPGGTVITRNGEDVQWWTWAGYRANATLVATFSGLTDSKQRFDDDMIRLRADLTQAVWKAGTTDAAERLCLPAIDEQALKGLKFNEALPERLAIATLAARLADLDSAIKVLAEPTRFVSSAG